VAVSVVVEEVMKKKKKKKKVLWCVGEIERGKG